MKYFLDTEFNGFGGELLSMGIVRDEEASLYLRVPAPTGPLEPWVAENVWPIIDSPLPIEQTVAPVAAWAHHIAAFLSATSGGFPYLITDWPDDVRYFCHAIITGPGEMAAIPRVQFDIVRVDAYPTDLAGAVRHNAWWDAMALRYLLRRHWA